jgi:hypothetical protein
VPAHNGGAGVRLCRDRPLPYTRPRIFHARARGHRVMGGPVKKIVLAYSGGLDTSVILRWLQET